MGIVYKAAIESSRLREDQQAARRVSNERLDQEGMEPDQGGHLPGRAVANLQEEEFGRSSVKKTALEKVVILGDDRVTIFAGKIPDHRVIGMIETVGVHM
jgi:hypothetical protein